MGHPVYNIGVGVCNHFMLPRLSLIPSILFCMMLLVLYNQCINFYKLVVVDQ